jgi:copper(I)-binding protein
MNIAMNIAMKLTKTALLITAALHTPALFAGQSLKISSAWIRVPPPGAKVTALYFTAENTGKTEQTITKINVAGADRTEMHQSTTDAKGMMRMEPLPQLKLDPNTTLNFAPGGNHAMVFGALPNLRAGAKIKVTVQLEGGASIQTEAVARGLGDSDTGQHQHSDGGTTTQHHHE